MPTQPNPPDGPEQVEESAQKTSDLQLAETEDVKGLIVTEEEERLTQIFEKLLIRQEEFDGRSSLTSEQIDLALRHNEEERRRVHDRRLLRDRNRHELELARREDSKERRVRSYEIRKTRLAFLPKVSVAFGTLVMLGTALIIYVLVSNNAKDQIPVV